MLLDKAAVDCVRACVRPPLIRACEIHGSRTWTKQLRRLTQAQRAPPGTTVDRD